MRSQTVYHGLAREMTPSTPNTIVLVSPKEPYVCIGCNQVLDKEVDIDFCHPNDDFRMPVVINQRLLDAKATAKYLSISVSKLYYWLNAGKIKGLKLDNKRPCRIRRGRFMVCN